ncbi:uncharacterized protein OCT59_020598 [Rhizophagus irregularis]|uniref:uncharacterized protein n=1 Tax=Rhizophagus irregularis TaxID=588596 RepID=UPI00331D1001|nr:hypothetical protein OCT59_020598 [Rhizophagus irregularis]
MAALNLNANLPVYIQWPDDAALDLNSASPTRKQCREKWNALKSGYENLERLINRNPEGYPTRTPTLHDERFHQELSDEFWRVEPLVRAAEEIGWIVGHTSIESAGALAPDPPTTTESRRSHRRH